MSKFKMAKSDKIVTGIIFGALAIFCIGGGIYSNNKTNYNDLVQTAQSKIQSSTKEILGSKYDDVQVKYFTDEKVGDKMIVNCRIGINGDYNDAQYVYNIENKNTIELSNKEAVEKNLTDILTKADEKIKKEKEKEDNKLSSNLQWTLSSFAINYMDGMCPINETMKYGASFLDKVKTNSDGTIQYKLTLKVTETNQYNAKMNYKAIFIFDVKSDYSDYDLVDYYVNK